MKRNAMLAITVGLVLGTIISMTGCAKDDEKKPSAYLETAKPSAEITATFAVTPEITPTPEPTATPLPENWVIDPIGIIPTDVEIVGPCRYGEELKENVSQWCLNRNKEGKAVLQHWGRGKGLIQEWEVPESLLETKFIMVARNVEGGVFLMATWENRYDTQFMLFYVREDGTSLFVENGKMYYGDASEFRIITLDNKLIQYNWGDAYYSVYQFDSKDDVKFEGGDAIIVINGTKVLTLDEIRELKYEKVNLS